MRPPCFDIADLLEGAGLGLTVMTNLFAVEAPESPDEIVLVVDSGGPGDTYLQNQSVEVRVRSKPDDYSGGYALAEACAEWLHDRIDAETNGARYLHLRKVTEVVRAGRDSRNRDLFAFSVECPRTESEDGDFCIALMTDTHIGEAAGNGPQIADCISWAVNRGGSDLAGFVWAGDNTINPNVMADFPTLLHLPVAFGGLGMPESMPVRFAIGNHDADLPYGSEWNDVYETNDFEPFGYVRNRLRDLYGSKTWGLWDHKHLRVMFLNNISDEMDEDTDICCYHNCNPPYSRTVVNPDYSGITTEGSPQRSWFDRMSKSGHRWKMAVCHRAVWNPCSDAFRPQNKLARPAFKSPIDSGLSILFSGDQHSPSHSGKWYPSGVGNEAHITRDAAGVGLEVVSLTGGYFYRPTDPTALPDFATTVAWSGCRTGTSSQRPTQVALLSFMGETAKLEVYEVSNAVAGEIVHTATINRNPGV